MGDGICRGAGFWYGTGRPSTEVKRLQSTFAEHPEIVVEWLPPYAPEINPEEFCHGNVKQQIKNATPVDKYALLTIVNRGFARLRHRPDLILSFFRHAGLSVKQLWSN